MDLSRIRDCKLRNHIVQIAQLDGEKQNAEINKPNEYEKLRALLNGNYFRKLESEEKDVIMGLKIEYESKYKNVNKNSNNIVRNVQGPVVIGSENVNIGGAGSINTSGDNNNIIIINVDSKENAEVVTDKIDKYKSHTKIPAADVVDGQTAAQAIYNEIHSFYARNNFIKNTCNEINENTAYSFFKEYRDLNGNVSCFMQDIYSVSDILQRITLEQASHLIKSLLKQAKNLNKGIEKTNAYIYLNRLVQKINNNKDPTDLEAIKYDKSINLVLKEMARVYGDKL